eukprot:CAMPEP_0119322544 /NCGR_PEP_ID=MMETSP1333-20130426/58512_1 /TAXON_ID=418940 /ORGANISM="Scyphosphaera apsteinii, Strain RCC1455" /LENGTH=140 /DNA_ID=CAMNT_0007329799 /DNA_START=665 /DNA_END=1088 /DNA_ORIENTATION=-
MSVDPEPSDVSCDVGTAGAASVADAGTLDKASGICVGMSGSASGAGAGKSNEPLLSSVRGTSTTAGGMLLAAGAAGAGCDVAGGNLGASPCPVGCSGSCCGVGNALQHLCDAQLQLLALQLGLSRLLKRTPMRAWPASFD